MANHAKKSQPAKDFSVVGIGASAGGIGALKEFFDATPNESGMAFVVILHLSQEHESNLAQILQSHTKMKVEQVTETVKVEPNRVYVIPPAKGLAMLDGTIKLTEPTRIRGKRVPIDLFFRTLADAYGKNGIAVVLSGTGSDGTLGLKRVKENGGIGIAQDPSEAEYDGMPRSAINTGLVDLVLPVAEMPGKLIELRDTGDNIRLPKEKDTIPPPSKSKDPDALNEILAIVRVRTGHDFTNYKHGTLLRRIARRMQVQGLTGLPEYLDFLRASKDEAQLLQRDLLITVTNYFRDKEAFDELEKEIVPKLFAGKTHADTVRVWSVGCATGEEAYSLAILLDEFATRLTDAPKIQVFASDINDEAIAAGRDCFYEETVVADLSPERLRHYFTTENGGYRVRKELRELILFAPHNILRDPPFSKLDLIVCRNLLIYFNRDTQEKVLGIFNFALRPDGFLFLGASESAESSPALFAVVDKKRRIYRPRPQPHHQAMPLMPSGKWNIKIPQLPIETGRPEQPNSYTEIHLQLIEQFAPPSVLVNEHQEIVHISEHAGRFLRFAGGEPTRELLKAVHPDLKLDLQAGIFEAKKDGLASESRNVRLKLNGTETLVNITVRFVQAADMADCCYLIIFDESKSEAAPNEEDQSSLGISGRDAMDHVVRNLENELKVTRERLRATVEQNETSSEELKASNEELQAINEELRSASEELETSKEELQSLNEELTTVNHELKDKVDETIRINSDLQNLIQSTDIGSIFLDRALRVKRYTPRVADVFNIIPSDVGRPLDHLTHKLDYDHLTEDAAEVMKDLHLVEREVRGGSEDDRYLVRLAPYRTTDDKIDGVVLSFQDITELKRAADIVEESETLFRSMIDAIPAAVYTTDAEGRLTHFNPAAVEFSGRTPELGTDQWCVSWKLFYEDGTPMAHDKCPMAIAIKEGRIMRDVEAIAERPDGTRVWFTPYPSPLYDRAGKIIGGINMLMDITERKRAEEASAYLAAIVESSDDAIISKDLQGGITTWNSGAEKLFGYTPAEALGKSITMLIPPLRIDEEPMILEKIRRGEIIDHYETVRRRKDGTDVDVSLTVSPVRDAAGKIIGASKIGRDITERKQAEQMLRDSEEQYRTLFNSMDEGYCIIEVIFNANDKPVDYRFEKVNRAFEQQSGMHDVVGKRMLEYVSDIEQHWLANYGQVAETGEPIRFVGEYKGLNRWFEVYVFKVGDPGDNRVAVLFTDITERKQAETAQREMSDALRQNAADLSELDRRKTEFLAMLAHELRNPLAPIRNALQGIRMKGKDGGRSADFDLLTSTSVMMERQVDHMVRLVDDLLDMSRISRGKIELRKEHVELASIVDQAVEATRPSIEAASHELSVSLPSESIYLNGDRTRLAQVVENLLTNAGKFTEKGGSIWLTVEPEGENVLVRVRDSGIGLAAEQLPRIFEMFTQVDTSLERSVSGLGIGLTLVKKLIELHGGSVEVHSPGIGQGSEFVVRLPVAAATTEPAAKPTLEKPAKAKAQRILVVDDNVDSATSMALLLSLDGHETDIAYDGREALEAAERFQPAVMLLDIGLPKLNGYEVCRAIRQQPWGHGMTMIALTGWGQEEDRDQSRNAGFDAHLIKPVDFDDLTKLLGTLDAARTSGRAAQSGD